jgi:hypothetical protein
MNSTSDAKSIYRECLAYLVREYAFAKSGSGKELRRWWTLASFLV